MINYVGQEFPKNTAFDIYLSVGNRYYLRHGWTDVKLLMLWQWIKEKLSLEPKYEIIT